MNKRWLKVIKDLDDSWKLIGECSKTKVGSAKSGGKESKMNYTDKILNILTKHFIAKGDAIQILPYKQALKELSSLLQESNEEAVIGFGNWLEDNHTDYGYVAMSDFGYEYLNGSAKQNETPELTLEMLDEAEKIALKDKVKVAGKGESGLWVDKEMIKPQDNIELKREIRQEVSDTVMDWLSEDKRFFGKKLESITKPIERFIDELTANFLPHLKDDNKIRREAVEGLWRYLEKEGWISQQVTSDIVSSVVEEYLKKEESENI